MDTLRSRLDRIEDRLDCLEDRLGRVPKKRKYINSVQLCRLQNELRNKEDALHVAGDILDGYGVVRLADIRVEDYGRILAYIQSVS